MRDARLRVQRDETGFSKQVEPQDDDDDDDDEDEDDDGEEKAEEDRSGDGGRVGSEAEVEPQG